VTNFFTEEAYNIFQMTLARNSVNKMIEAIVGFVKKFPSGFFFFFFFFFFFYDISDSLQ
jgi:hypothetical protein